MIGNHDARVEGGRYEFRTLGMRGRYYKRTAGPAELFLLDSNRVDSAQTAWLARSLARSKARWKIAVFHHPAFTCGTTGRIPTSSAAGCRSSSDTASSSPCPATTTTTSGSAPGVEFAT